MQFLSRELGPGSFGLDAGNLVSVGVEGFPVGQDAPCDTGKLVGQGRGELVSMKPGCGLGEPRPEAEFLPIVRSHQDDMRSLDEEGPQIFAAALGYASKDRFAARAVLAGNETDPSAKVTSTPESFTRSYGGHHRRRYDRPDTGNAHQPLAVFLGLADHLDLAGDALDAIVELQPVFVEADNQIVHARRYLVGAVPQDWKERLSQGMRTGANGYSLFDQERANLIDRRRSSRDQA